MDRRTITAEQLGDAEQLAKLLSEVPKEKRITIVMMANSFIAGMDAQKAMDEVKRVSV